MIVLLKQNEPYRVGKILLVNKEPVVNPVARSEKKGTEWSVPENIPKYKIAAKCGSFINILVSSNTTDEQLRSLVSTFKEARINNSFHKMIPKTSEGKINNGYEKVFIQVFTKPQWASEDKLKVVCGKGPTPNNPQERLQDVKFNDEYNKHNKAYYEFEIGSNGSWGECGSLGYAELGQNHFCPAKPGLRITV